MFVRISNEILSHNSKNYKPDYKKLFVSDGAFYQQRLPAWKPIINIHSTVPVFGVLGIFLVPIGLLLITTAGSVSVISHFQCFLLLNIIIDNNLSCGK